MMKLIIAMIMVVIMSMTTTMTMRYMLMMKMVLVATNLTASLLQRSLLVFVVELLNDHVHPRARSQLLRQADDGDDLQNMLGRKFIQMDNGDGDAVWCSMVMLPLLFIHISLLNHQ